MSLESNIKVCTHCGIEKDESEFYKRKTNKDGLRYWCKECDKKQAAKWNKKNPEKYAANLKRWKINNREKHLEHGRKNYRLNKNDQIRYMKHRARMIVNHAIESGTMTRQQCKVFDCFDIGEAHYEDYRKPLNVEWLCKKHHVEKERSSANDLGQD